jgi:peptidoglycan/LPS O-acetylase OafA/YrhL
MREGRRLEWVVVLRGAAALWVFAFHIWLALGGLAVRFGLPFDFSFGLRSLFRAGYQGVDLFFVLSGFVIAWPFVAAREIRLDRYQVADFYQRRLLRIAPIYYVTIAVATVLMSAGLLRGTVDGWSIAAHLAFAQNFVPEWVASIRGVYWTLPTEMHFYLLFPLLLRFVDVDRPLRLAFLMIAAAIAYRWLLVWLGTRHGVWLTWTAAYLPGRIDQFGCGIAAACVVATARPEGKTVRASTVVLAGLLAVACLMLIGRNATTQLDFWFIAGPSIAGAGIAFFIAALGIYSNARPDASPARGSGTARLFHLLGDASLSIYLWHTFFIDLALLATLRFALDNTAKVALVIATVPVAILTSVVTYRLIEAPMIALSKSPAWRSRVRHFVDHVFMLPGRRASRRESD